MIQSINFQLSDTKPLQLTTSLVNGSQINEGLLNYINSEASITTVNAVKYDHSGQFFFYYDVDAYDSLASMLEQQVLASTFDKVVASLIESLANLEQQGVDINLVNIFPQYIFVDKQTLQARLIVVPLLTAEPTDFKTFFTELLGVLPFPIVAGSKLQLVEQYLQAAPQPFSIAGLARAISQQTATPQGLSQVVGAPQNQASQNQVLQMQVSQINAQQPDVIQAGTLQDQQQVMNTQNQASQQTLVTDMQPQAPFSSADFAQNGAPFAGTPFSGGFDSSAPLTGGVDALAEVGTLAGAGAGALGSANLASTGLSNAGFPNTSLPNEVPVGAQTNTYPEQIASTGVIPSVQSLPNLGSDFDATPQAPSIIGTLTESQTGRVSSITKVPFVIGRHPKLADFVLQSPHISAVHAKITSSPDGRLAVVDNNSTNGVFVNSARILAGTPVPITSGDTIKFGDVEYTFSKL